MAFKEECALVYCYCVSNEGNYNFQCDLEGKVILGVNWVSTNEILMSEELSG